MMQNSTHSQTNHGTIASSDSGGDSSSAGGESGKWAAQLLQDCARAISENDSGRIHHLLWMLNELASPYGDCDQKLASYFLQALFCKATDSGERCHKTLMSAAEKSQSFESARKVILKFQEVSPWTTFGHVAANGAILEALEGETKLHIIDISNTYCTQWPTLMETLATKSEETPQLRLTVVVSGSGSGTVMREIGRRMEKFARLMGVVPFEFQVVSGLDRLAELTKEELRISDEEAVAVNCISALRRVEAKERAAAVAMLQSLHPKVVTVVEEEADLTNTRNDFVKCFDECLRFYGLFFEMLEQSFVPTSHERLMLERECSRSIVRVLACQEQSGCERRERGSQWCTRLKEAFFPLPFSEDVVDDVKALLKRYRGRWSFMPAAAPSAPASPREEHSGLYLFWKEEAVVWASAWKPLNV